MRRRFHSGIDLVHLARYRLARQGIGYDTHLLAYLHLGVVGFGHAHEELDRSDLLHRENGGRHGVHVAAVVVAGGDHAGDGAAQDGVLLQVVASGLGNVVLQFHGFIVALGDAALLVQLLKAFELGFSVGQLQLLLGELNLVHLGQDLALGHERTHVNVDFLDTVAALRGDVVNRESLHSGGIDLRLGDLLLLHFGHGYPDRRDCRVCRPAGSFFAGILGACGQCKRRCEYC